MWLRERAPHRSGGNGKSRSTTTESVSAVSFAHWSTLLSKSSSASNRLSQNPVIWLVQSIERRERVELRAIMGLAAFMAIAHEFGLFQKAARCFETAGCETPERARQCRDRLFPFAA